LVSATVPIRIQAAPSRPLLRLVYIIINKAVNRKIRYLREIFGNASRSVRQTRESWGQARGISIVKHYTDLPAHTRLGGDGATRLRSLRLHDFVDQE
jgi:hypothetical protein